MKEVKKKCKEVNFQDYYIEKMKGKEVSGSFQISYIKKINK